MGLCMRGQLEVYGSVHRRSVRVLWDCPWRSVVVRWVLSMGGQLQFDGHCQWEVSCSSVGLCMGGQL